MNLAYLTNLNAVDGTKTNADRLCREFDQRDEIDLTAVHIQATNAPENFWTDELGYEALYPRSFRKGIETVDPDIVLIHGYNVDMIDYLTDYAPEDDRIYVLRNGVNTMEQWLSLYSSGDPRRVAYTLSKFDVFDGVFCPSTAAAERLNFAYGSDTPHLAVAPCVIDYDQYAPSPFMDDGDLHVILASRMAPVNYTLGPILALQRLAVDDDASVKMQVLGGGDRPYREVIEMVTEEMPHVEVTGHLSPADAKAHMEAADVLCVPSVTQQAVPTTAVEGLAAGCVVVSGAYQSAYEEETMIRAPADHPPAWYEVLSDIIESPDEAVDRIQDGLEAAKQYDTARIVTEAYLPTFNLLLAEREMESDDPSTE